MENCRVTTFKGNADISNPEYYGYAKVHINTNGRNGDSQLMFVNMNTGASYTNPVGSKLLGGKTFVNGKTEIEEGDAMKFAANDTYELLVPKYHSPIIAPSVAGNESNGLCAYNIDDYEYVEFENKQPSDNWIDSLNFSPTVDGIKCSGNIDRILDWANPAVTKSVITENSNVSVNISSSEYFLKLYSLRTVKMRNDKNAEGSVRGFLSAYSAANASYLKSRTNTLTFWLNGSSIDLGVFEVQNLLNIRLNFTGASAITIDCVKTDGTTVLKSFNYDIDTDALTEA